MASPLIGTVGIGVEVDARDVLKQLTGLGVQAGNAFAKNFNRAADDNVKPLEVEAEVDTSNIPRELDKAAEKGGNVFTRTFGRVAGMGFQALKISSGVAFTAIGAAGASAFAKGFGRLNAIDQATNKLDGLKFSAEEIDSVMASALEAVKDTAFGLGEAASAAAMFGTAGIRAGDDMTTALKLTADLASIAGTSMMDVSGILTDVAAKGKVTGDTVQRLGDRGVDALSALSDHYGITREEASKMVSSGEVDFANFAAAMDKNIGGAAKKAGDTFMGAMKNIGAAMGRLGAAALKPLFDAFIVVAPAIMDSIDGITAAFTPIFESVGPMAAEALTGIGDALNKIDWKAVAQTVSDVWAAIQDFFGQMSAASESLKDTFSDLFERMAEALASIDWAAVGELIVGVWDAVAAAIEVVVKVAQAMWDAGLDTLFYLLRDAIMAIDWEWIAEIITKIGGILEDWAGFINIAIGAWVAYKGATKFMDRHRDSITGVRLALKKQAGASFLAEKGQQSYNRTMKATGTVTKITTGITKLFSKALWTSPITWIVAGIMLLIGALILLWKNWDQVVQWITDVFGGFIDWVKGLIDAFVAWWEPIWQGISDFFVNLWEGLVAWWTPIWEKIWAVVQFIIDLIVNYFRFWAAVAMWLWENAIKPALKFIADLFEWLWKNAIKPIIDFIVDAIHWFGDAMEWLYENAVKPTIDFIAAAFQWLWDHAIQPVIDLVAAAIEGWGIIFTWLYEEIIKPIWEGIQKVFKAGWDFIEQKVFKPFKDGIDAVADGFEIAVSAIEKTWNSIKEMVAKPINFVLDTIWNNGLRSFWNDLVTTLKLPDMKLPKAPLVSFAKGGVMPGYTPGRDVHHFFSPTAGYLNLSGGEGIIRPDALRRLGGKRWLDAVNGSRGRKPRTGGSDVNGKGSGDKKHQGILGDAWDWIADAASIAWEFLTDPKDAIEKYVIDGIIRPKIGDLNIFGKTIAGLAGNTIRAFIPKFKDASPQAAGGSKGMGWEAMAKIVTTMIPGARITSGFRPGARTVNGGKSFHGAGRAIDIIPATMKTFSQVRALFPNATELIFTPAGAAQLPSGNWSEAVRRQHYDHVHLAMKNGGIFDTGGWLKPGALGMNMGNRPEAVFTAGQFDKIERSLVQVETLAAATRGYRSPGMNGNRTTPTLETAADGSTTVNVGSGAIQIVGPDPYKASLLTVNRLSEMAAL